MQINFDPVFRFSRDLFSEPYNYCRSELATGQGHKGHYLSITCIMPHAAGFATAACLKSTLHQA